LNAKGRCRILNTKPRSYKDHEEKGKVFSPLFSKFWKQFRRIEAG
jgi:hypothetical protein